MEPVYQVREKVQEYYPVCPEALIVGLARTGDRDAFTELVRRHQSSIRQLMRRCCGDATLADDLAQQVFLQAWLKIRMLKAVNAFNTWLRKLAISIWLQANRKRDTLAGGTDLDEGAEDSHFEQASQEQALQEQAGMRRDLEKALMSLSASSRLCVVLSYHEGMSHQEIADITNIPLGTVKSNIARGSEHLRQILSAYRNSSGRDTSSSEQGEKP